MIFYNTINENPSELARSQSKAKTQEQKIINCFKQYERPLSPSMVLSISGLNCPITSIRRAMTNYLMMANWKKQKTLLWVTMERKNIFGVYLKNQSLSVNQLYLFEKK